jgi:hypothetical protein
VAFFFAFERRALYFTSKPLIVSDDLMQLIPLPAHNFLFIRAAARPFLAINKY